jgi:hypothetical protein
LPPTYKGKKHVPCHIAVRVRKYMRDKCLRVDSAVRRRSQPQQAAMNVKFADATAAGKADTHVEPIGCRVRRSKARHHRANRHTDLG